MLLMKKSSIFLRIFILIAIAGPAGLVVYQNSEYFLETTALSVSVPQLIPVIYSAPGASNLAYWSICLLAGLVIAFCYGLVQKYTLKKQIKQLEARLADLQAQQVAVTDEVSPSYDEVEGEALAETVVLSDAENDAGTEMDDFETADVLEDNSFDKDGFEKSSTEKEV
jgi:hypothetical protein